MRVSSLSYIEEETKGGYSKERGRGQSTRFIPTPKMVKTCTKFIEIKLKMDGKETNFE